ncbi:hypothetical protein ES703_67341 [subsurface metagenome]
MPKVRYYKAYKIKGKKMPKKYKRRLSVKISDGRKRIQIGGKKYRLVPVGKIAKKRGRPSKAKRKRTRKGLPPRDSKGRFRKSRSRK